MMRLIAAVAVLGTVGTVPAAAQAQWDESRLESGTVEFRLRNDDGAAIVLGCRVNGVYTGFEFPEPLEDTERATLRGIPGDRQNVAVARVNERAFRVTGRGIDETLRLLRTSSRLNVRLAGESADFEVFGSRSTVLGCLARQEALPPGL